MPDTIHGLLADIEKAAAELGDADVVARVRAVADLARSPKLRILIAGSTGCGRSLVANLLLGQPDTLPSSPVPKRPVTVLLDYRESPTLTITLRGGLSVAEPVERLRALLIGADPEADDAVQLRIGVNAELLKTADVRIEPIDGPRGEGGWQELLASTSFILVVLRAPALLSATEAAFIESSLQPAIASGRVATLVNQIDLVSPEERPALNERLRNFFGSFEREPPIIQLSAGDAVRALRSGAPAAGGAAELEQFVRADLVGRHGQLTAAAVQAETSACIAALRASAMQRRSLSSLSQSASETLLETLDTRNAWLRSRIERAEQRVELYVSTLARERLLSDVESFSLAFKEQLPAELAQIHDLALLRRYLPGYLDTVWSEFFEARLPGVRAALAEELEQIARQAAADLRELAEHAGLESIELAAGFDTTPGLVRSFWQPHRSDSGAAAVATNMQFAGLLLLLLPGLQLIGAASIGVGQVVRMATRRAEEDAARKAILDAIIEAWPGMERQIDRQTEARFAALAAALRETVRSMYERALQAPRAAIAETAERREALRAEAGALDRLLGQSIPALESRLHSFHREPDLGGGQP